MCTQLGRPFFKPHFCYFPNLGKLSVNIQDAFSYFISVMHYIQVVLVLPYPNLQEYLNVHFNHLAQVQCSSTGTEDCVAALRNRSK